MEYAQMSKVPSSVQEMPSSEEALRTVRESMDQYMAVASEKARAAAAYADRRVHDSPWTAVGIGFGAGVVFGALIVLAAKAS
ncbi:MAG TPA: hypothetical protein VM489_08750 [Burkholderiales bacterium]|nr:hypothetical protein [Burkholderiales bacterium]